MYNKDLHNKFTAVVKTLKISDSDQQDIFNSLVDLLNRKELIAAGEIWGEYADWDIKATIRKKIKNIDELFEEIQMPKTVKELFELRAKLNGEIDFRTKVGNQTKKFISNMKIDSRDLLKTPEELEAEMIKKKLTEKAVRRVDSDGAVTKTNDAETAERRADNGSSQSKGERDRIGQKAAATRAKDPRGVAKAVEKRKAAQKIRKERGIQ